MPETQVGKLRDMMHHRQPASYLDACLAPFDIKKSALKELGREDIIVLPTRSLDITLVDRDNNIVALGHYGSYRDTPSVLIDSISNISASPNDTNKYKILKVSFGRVNRYEIDQGKIIPLNQDNDYDAVLYTGAKIVAYASLILADEKIALRIERVE